MKDKRGFTLSELLIVVAVIAVLVAISIPIFTTQLKKSRAAVDQAHVRSAKASAAAAYMMNEEEGEMTYFYDAGDGTVEEEEDGIVGYGKSTEELTGALDDYAAGVPKSDGTAHIVKVTIMEDGEVQAVWTGGAAGTETTKETGTSNPETAAPVTEDKETGEKETKPAPTREEMRVENEKSLTSYAQTVFPWQTGRGKKVDYINKGDLILDEGNYYLMVGDIKIKYRHNETDYGIYNTKCIKVNMDEIATETSLPPEGKYGQIIKVDDRYYVYYSKETAQDSENQVLNGVKNNWYAVTAK